MQLAKAYWLVLTEHFVLVSYKRMQNHKKELGTRNGMEVIRDSA